MNTPQPQSTLREWRDHMRAPARLAAFAGAAAILALAGPFESGEVMRPAPRLAYWAVVVLTCYSIGYWSSILAERVIGSRDGFFKKLLIAASLTSVGVVAAIYLLNGLALNYWPTGKPLAILAANVAVISSIITTVFHVADTQDTAQPTPSGVPLLDRLPIDKRAPLVSVSVEDHYVRIRTTKAEEMVLMRLADAIRETADTGLQVHRSHWVATSQVKAATRKGDGAILTMATGPDIPVSRTNIAKIKEAGLLPR